MKLTKEELLEVLGRVPDDATIIIDNDGWRSFVVTGAAVSDDIETLCLVSEPLDEYIEKYSSE